MSIIESLRLSSKGHLKYDLFGETPIQTLIDEVNKTRNSLLFPRISKSTLLPKDDEESISPPKKVETQKTKVGGNKEIFEDTVNEIQLKFLEEYEVERKISVQNFVRQRKDLLDNECNLSIQNTLKRFQDWENEREQIKREQLAEQLNQSEERKLKLKQKQQNLKEHNEKLNKNISAKIKEGELKQKQLEQKNLEKLQELKHQQQLMDSLLKCQKDVNEKYLIIVDKLNACTQKQFISEQVKTLIHEQRHVAESLNHLISASKERHLTEDDLKTAHNIFQQVTVNVGKISSAVDAANAFVAQSAESRPSLIKENLQQSSIHQPTTVQQSSTVHQPSISQAKITHTPPTTSSQIKPNDSTIPPAESTDLYQCITRGSLIEYVKLQTLAKKYQESYADLFIDSSPRMKMYRLDLQKATNTPTNAIASLSGSHLKDKLNRLKRFLQGQTVDVGNRRVSTREHPHTTAFCKDLLAKKFVKLGEEQVSSKHETAFAIAAVIIGLWTEIEDFGDLFLAHLHKKCPYTVPYYIEREENQSKEDCYKAQGYIYINNVIEDQNQFLKRMSGMMCLYSAIICSPPPDSNSPHPHGIEHGWKWLARVLNLEPRLDVTATLICDFLETAGHAMQNNYKNQFQKLISFLCSTYLPKIVAVTPSDVRGPIVRLENFLEKYLRHNRIPPPQGYISSSFWLT